MIQTRSCFFNGLLLAVILITGGCVHVNDPAQNQEQLTQLKKAVTFYASFDSTLEADYAAGDPRIYQSESWEHRYESRAGLPSKGVVERVSDEGRFGDALKINNRQAPVVHYKAEENVSYHASDWHGTVSFWLKLDPDKDLEPGFSDPIQLTSRSWNDRCFFVDFTKDDSPRHFRFAAFSDRDIWDPDKRKWDDVPVEERPMVEISQPPLSSEKWTHVCMTWANFNTGNADGILRCYLDGKQVGELVDRRITFTWEPNEALIWFGINFQGWFDELIILNRDLSNDEVKFLYELPTGLTDL